MKYLFLFAMLSLFGCRKASTQDVPESIYEFKLVALDGEEVDFGKYKGKKLLIVNTASKCGYTPQYEGLQKLSELYSDKVLVLGFPANNFLWQEPGPGSGDGVGSAWGLYLFGLHPSL